MAIEAEHPEPGNRHLRALLDALVVGVLVADDAAVYVDANRAACRILGRSRDRILGTRVGEIVDPERKLDVEAQWSAFLRDGEQSGAFELLRPDGSTVRVSFQARANFVAGLHCSFLTPLPEIPGCAAVKPKPQYPVLCAWTKRVKLDDTWVSIEEYLLREHDVLVTHGLSPGAAQELEREDPE